VSTLSQALEVKSMHRAGERRASQLVSVAQGHIGVSSPRTGVIAPARTGPLKGLPCDEGRQIAST
jgi:hypothetical protein